MLYYQFKYLENSNFISTTWEKEYIAINAEKYWVSSDDPVYYKKQYNKTSSLIDIGNFSIYYNSDIIFKYNNRILKLSKNTFTTESLSYFNCVYANFNKITVQTLVLQNNSRLSEIGNKDNTSFSGKLAYCNTIYSLHLISPTVEVNYAKISQKLTCHEDFSSEGKISIDKLLCNSGTGNYYVHKNLSAISTSDNFNFYIKKDGNDDSKENWIQPITDDGIEGSWEFEYTKQNSPWEDQQVWYCPHNKTSPFLLKIEATFETYNGIKNNENYIVIDPNRSLTFHFHEGEIVYGCLYNNPNEPEGKKLKVKLGRNLRLNWWKMSCKLSIWKNFNFKEAYWVDN